MLAPAAVPWRGDPPDGAWLVTAPRGGALVYLGSLRPEEDIPDDASILDARLLGGDLPPLSGSLFQVTGWLVTRTAVPFLDAVPDRALGRTSHSRRVGAPGRGEVTIEDPVIDVDPEDAVSAGHVPARPAGRVRPGRCLGDLRGDQPLGVVARYEPGRSVRVQVP